MPVNTKDAVDGVRVAGGDAAAGMRDDPWRAVFGFFWYNDEQIFHWQTPQFQAEAEKMAADGVTHVITFSCTHFRWSFRRWWPLLTDTLARLVAGCHAAGIKVIEHHSSNLTHNPLNAKEEELLDRILAVRKSARASWPELRADCDADPVIDGKPFSSFRQIAGLTGQWARSNYGGYGLCYNNPDYRRAYFEYLATLYQTGIDGIMTDDVQLWGGDLDACACPVCRRLFAERTGWELPDAGAAWRAWAMPAGRKGNYDDPKYIAWLQFRMATTQNFHQAVKDHYASLGLRLLRPNYQSHLLRSNNWSAYTFEQLPALDWVFQENCFSELIRTNWPVWACEARHRVSVGRRRGIPAMSMFYPDDESGLLFTWALAMSWGQLYLATPEGRPLTGEKRLRDFERRHAGWLHAVRPLARLAFYDSRATRYYYEHAMTRSLPVRESWMHAGLHHNLPMDLMQPEDLGRVLDYRVIVLNEMALLSDAELAAFRQFVAAGGCLVWTGATGTRDDRGRARAAAALQEIWGADFAPPADDAPARELRMGAGRLILTAGDFGGGLMDAMYSLNRWAADAPPVVYKAMPESVHARRRELAGWLAGLLPDGPDLTVTGLPPDILVTVFQCPRAPGLVIHLLNAAGMLQPLRDGDPLTHHAPLVFPALPAGRAELTVRLPDAAPDAAGWTAVWHALDMTQAESVTVRRAGRRLTLGFDPAWLRVHAMVGLTTERT